MPAHILEGTAHINGLNVTDYNIVTVLDSINGSYDYVAYYDNTNTWKVYDVTAVVDTFGAFPTGVNVPSYTFSIHMTAGATLDIESK